MPNILVVDDESSMRQFLQILLEKEGYAVRLAGDAASALAAVDEAMPDLVITDIRMPQVSGLDLLARLKERCPDLAVIMITAFASPEDAVQAMKNGAFDYITKPFKVDEIKQVVRAALERKSRQPRQTRLEDEFPEIIGSSPEMLRIFDLIKRIAPTPANVLIYGESGTGKELVAKAIHRHSRVARQPFVPINCSAIPESLIESELFGHVKGAFTGAVTDKIGLFEQADGGTIFLDEVGELSALVQTKLLRVLQEREILPVGGTRPRRVEVRVVAATNRNLEEEVMAGRFREDLYYRLAVVPIRVPPLRERKGDVPLLVDHFLKKYSRLLGKEVEEISSYGLQVLMDYDFPGNVRELENIIERSVALESSKIVLPESLILSHHRQAKQATVQADAGIGRERGGDARQDGAPLFVAAWNEEELFAKGLEQILTDLEKEILLYALQRAGGSKMKAAELLGVSFRSLRYKIKKYHLG